MDIPKYFNNVVLAQFKATGMPLKVYVNGQYLIIPDVYEISDPLLGSGMNPNGEMLTFDYRDIDHLLVGKNIIDLATYTKAMTGDTPEEDAKKDEEPKESTMPSIKDILAEISQEEVDAEVEGAEAEMDSAKAKLKAAQAAMKNTIKKSKEKIKAAKSQPIDEALDENVDRPEEKKTAILNAIAKEEKRSEFQNRILNQIKRAIVDGEPLFKLPFKTQADYRKLMKMYKIPFSSKKAEKGNLRAESVNEAWIGPFVFGNTTKDDELKAMYDGALDGYANWKSGTVHPRADYKKAYQAIEKLLKRRGIQVESINELTYTTYWMGLDVRPPSYGNSELHTIAMELFGKKDFSKLSQSQKDKVVSKIPGDKKLYKTYGRGGSKKLSTESIIKKGSYVTNDDGLVGRVDNISGDKEIADIRYNDGKEESLPIKNLKIFENNYTFGIGDIIKNKNTSCPHHGSIGIVQKIMQLGADNPGKIVKYRVVNSGPTYKPGDVLSKTIDQLEPMGL